MPSTERVSPIIGLLCMKWLCLLDLCEDTNSSSVCFSTSILSQCIGLNVFNTIYRRDTTSINIATIFLLVNDHLDFIQLSQHVVPTPSRRSPRTPLALPLEVSDLRAPQIHLMMPEAVCRVTKHVTRTDKGF